MQRIRYGTLSTDANKLIAVQPILVVNQFVNVVLTPTETSAVIVNVDTATVLATVKAKTLAALKKAVKQELVNLGATFEPEVRPRVTKTSVREPELEATETV
jgi:hypothetical protein